MTSSLEAIFLSLIAGLATGIGGLITAIPKFSKINVRLNCLALGFAAGVMLEVSCLELPHEVINISSVVIVVIGIVLGALGVGLIDYWIPHIHTFAHRERMDEGAVPMFQLGLLMAMGMMLHNLPEGFVVGVSYTASPNVGLLVAIAIALHNIPEGLAVSVPLRVAGVSRHKALAITVLSGLAEPFAALIGVLFVGSAASAVLGMSLALAAGSMIYITGDELIPQSHIKGHEHIASTGLILGFTSILIVSALLGT